MATKSFTTKQILKAIGCPALQLYKGEGYWYFCYDTLESGGVYDTRSVMSVNLGHLLFDTWVNEGNGFVVDMQAKEAEHRVEAATKLTASAKKAKLTPAAIKAKLADLQQQMINTNGHGSRARIREQMDALEARLAPKTNRATAKDLHVAFEAMCEKFATDNGLIKSNLRGRFATHGAFSMNVSVEFSMAQVENQTMAVATAETLADRLEPKASVGLRTFIVEQALKGDLFKISETSFGPITGYNSRAPKSPIQYTQVSQNGEPVKHRNYKCQNNGTYGIGVRASEVADLELIHGDLCYVDYQPEVQDDPEDMPGFYAARVLSFDKTGAVVKYENEVEQFVEYTHLISALRFI